MVKHVLNGVCERDSSVAGGGDAEIFRRKALGYGGAAISWCIELSLDVLNGSGVQPEAAFR
jgi:hypothetical protein